MQLTLGGVYESVISLELGGTLECLRTSMGRVLPMVVLEERYGSGSLPSMRVLRPMLLEALMEEMMMTEDPIVL